MKAITSFRGNYDFLSNFYLCDFTVDDLGPVHSAEHAFGALKTSDPVERRWVLAARTPAGAMGRGQGVTLREDWDTGGRVSAMWEVLMSKFEIPDLEARLRATGDALLVEGNTHHDNFWGDCLCGAATCRLPGVNMLGEILMAIRSNIADGPEEPPVVRPSQDWEEMTGWLIDSLTDQPAGLEVSVGPKDVRLLVEKEAIVLDLDAVSDDDMEDDEPLLTPAICAQAYVLTDGAFLVRRSRFALRTIRFIDHDPATIERNTWFYDNPFDDCTDGYIYVDDPEVAAEIFVSWFRDNPEAPTLEQLGCHYEFAERLPDGS